jgi:hypothetical protein
MKSFLMMCINWGELKDVRKINSATRIRTLRTGIGAEQATTNLAEKFVCPTFVNTALTSTFQRGQGIGEMEGRPPLLTRHDCCAFFDSRNRTNTAKASTYFAVYRLVPSPAGLHLANRKRKGEAWNGFHWSIPSAVFILVMWCAKLTGYR